MQKIYGNKFQQFNFKSIMISKVIILILIFLTSIFDKWCCSLIISSAASSHDNAWAKRKFGLLLPLIYIKYMVTVFKHKLYLCKGKKICQKARLAGWALFTFSTRCKLYSTNFAGYSPNIALVFWVTYILSMQGEVAG